MNRKKLEKLISNHNFNFNQQLFSETDALVEVAIKTGENTALLESIETTQEETTEKIESVEMRQKWNDDSIDTLYNKVYELQDKIDSIEVKEIIEEEKDPTIHKEEETIIETPEEQIQPEKNQNMALFLGTLIFGTVVVFLIKLYENRGGGDKE